MIAREPSLDLTAASTGARKITFPCSQSQLRFWVEEQLSPQNPALNVAVRWRLDGTLTHTVLEEAWRRLVNRHDPLRTAFRAVDGDPVQIVEPHVPFSIPIFDLREMSETDRSSEADRLTEIEARTPFDIATAPLIRVTRLILSEQTTILLITAHHTVCDGWSIGILAREMGQICAALEAGVAPFLPELGLCFGEFAAWERQQTAKGSLETERAYVREMLRGYKQFELLPDHPRPRRITSNAAIGSVLLDRALTDALARLARSNGCTLFMTSLAALFALFHRYTGELDIMLGTQVVGRDDEELEKLVGCFINTIALRGDLSGDPDFITLLDRTREMVADSFDLRQLPLQELVEIAKPARDPSRNALFSVNFIFQRSFITNESYGTFKLVDLPSRSAGALYDLNVFMVERPEGWRVSCEYNTDLFDTPTITGLLDRFLNLLRSVAADPAQTISEIPILSEADRRSLVVTANRTQAAYPADKTLPQLIAEQVARRPNATAVICGDRSLTYAQLDAAVQRLARQIVRHGCTRGTRIGILLDRSADMLVAMLAVLESGCAYVPLDPKYPPERLAFIMADSRLGATITRATLAKAINLSDDARILVDGSVARADIDSSAALNVCTSPDDIAYVIYTSGSTGKPKGVQIQHKALLNLLWAMRERPGLTQSDTLVAVTTISFDIAGLELFLPLVTGAKLVIATEFDVVDGRAMLQLLQRTHATIMQATPVTWQLLIDAGWCGDPQLTMLCGGEALSRHLAEQLLERGSELWNMYGPTETTIWSAVARVTHGRGPVLIGPPIANTRFYVLDRNGALVPPGVPGELHIGGDGVALGYFEREDLTRERFVPDAYADDGGALMYRTGDTVRTRACGYLEFLGRTDNQIKLRGFRIELDEIVAELMRQPGVADAVAILIDDAAGDSSIRAYVVGQPAIAQHIDEWPALLRAQIAEFLPNYMLPAAIVILDRLPRTPNGKIDRGSLPLTSPLIRGSTQDLPVTPTEVAVAKLVCELLGHEQVGRNDDLFVLGLHSLLTVRLVARVARFCETRLPLRAVFENPTIAGVAASIDSATSAASAQNAIGVEPIVVYNEGGSETAFTFFHNDAAAEGLYCSRLSAAIGPLQPLYAVSPHGSAGLPVLTTIEAMALDYLNRLHALQPHGPYRIGGYCAGGLVAYELARQLKARGETVEQLLMVNASVPPPRVMLIGDQILRRIGLDARLEPLLRERIFWNVLRFFDSLGSGPRTTLRFLVSRLKLLTRLSGAADGRVNGPGLIERQAGSSETESYFANLVAAYTFHPKPYDGEIVLIWGSDQPATPGGPATGWKGLVRNVRVISVPGGHLSPVKEGIDELGQLIVRTSARET